MRRLIRLLAVLHVVEGGVEYVAALLIGAGSGWGSLQNDAGFEAPRERSAAVVALIFVGTLRIAAGWMCWSVRGRALGLASLVLGTIASVTCCPTPAALFVFGLFVYLHPEVRAAFEARRGGATAREALDGVDVESAELAAVFDDDPPTDDPRGLCDDDLARAVIALLPEDWTAAVLELTESAGGARGDVDVDIKGVAGASVEPDRGVARAVVALEKLLRRDGVRLAGARMRLWREDTWRFEWTEPPA